MKHGVTRLICVGGCIALAVVARAAVNSATVDHSVNSDNPYGAIVERNIFDLHDPPPPPPDKGPDKGPPPNIKLTGITTIFGRSQALFILNKPGAAGKPPASLSLILNEGQRQGEVEVLEINPKARSAKVKIDEVESVLTIETNKGTINMPANAGAPGAPGVRPSPYAAPGTPPGFPHNPYGAPGGDKGIPPRPQRTDAQPYGSGNPYGAGAPGVQPQAGGLNLTGPAATGTAATQPNQQLSPDEQAILIEAQRTQAQATGDPVQTILPPTHLSVPPPNSEPPPNDSGNPNPNPDPSSQLPPALQPKGNLHIPGR